METNGITCEEGYYLITTCGECAFYDSTYMVGHYEETYDEMNEYDGFCGMHFHSSMCYICGIELSSTFNEYCEWVLISNDAILTYECSICGAIKTQGTLDTGIVQNGETLYQDIYYIKFNDEIIVDYTKEYYQ